MTKLDRLLKSRDKITVGVDSLDRISLRNKDGGSGFGVRLD